MVVVRWPGKAAEHSFVIDLFVTFCIQGKKLYNKVAMHQYYWV